MVMWDFFDFLFGNEGVVFWVCIQMIVVGRFFTVNIVPPVTIEFLLIKNGSVCAQEWSSLMAFSSIVTSVIGLASCFYIGVHSRNGWHIVTRKTSVRNFMVDWVVYSWLTGNFAEILFLLLGLSDFDVFWLFFLIQATVFLWKIW